MILPSEVLGVLQECHGPFSGILWFFSSLDYDDDDNNNCKNIYFIIIFLMSYLPSGRIMFF